MVSTPGVEPGTHWWEASALTTAQSLAPLLDGPGGGRGTKNTCAWHNRIKQVVRT